MNSLEDIFLKSLIARFDQPGVIGIPISDSFSRGRQDEFSDVDLEIFLDELPEDHYMLRIFDGILVSGKHIRLADKLDLLTKPERAVWSVPGLRNMQILSAEGGEPARLKHAAMDIKWSALQSTANDYAVNELPGCSEEARKVMSGSIMDSEAKVLYAAWGMFKNLSFAALVQAGLMIKTKNRVFAIIEEHIGKIYRHGHKPSVSASAWMWKTVFPRTKPGAWHH